MSSEGVLLREYRCRCGRLLFRGLLLVSVVEIKCKKCGSVCVFRTIEEPHEGFTEYYLLIERKGLRLIPYDEKSRFWEFALPQTINMLGSAESTME